MALQLRTGGVVINGGPYRQNDAPIGGYKRSGLGREFGDGWQHQYTHGKSIMFPIGLRSGSSTTVTRHNARMEDERLEAIGQKGEACIIIVRNTTLPNGAHSVVYTLATGERLNPATTAGEFVTLNGSRTFRLRHRGTSDAGPG